MVPKKDPVATTVDLGAEKIVHAETKESAETNELLKDLLQKARDEASRVDDEVACHEKSSEEAANRVDQAGWSLVRLMLEIAETFDDADGSFNDAALEAFLVASGAKPHGNVRNPWRRLAKVCCPNSKPSLVSKRGYVLAALRNRNIAADAAIEELQKSEPIGPNGAQRTGMARFLELDRQDRKAEVAATVSKTSAATEADIATNDSRFDRLTDEELVAELELLVAEIKKRNPYFKALIEMPPGSDTLQ